MKTRLFQYVLMLGALLVFAASPIFAQERLSLTVTPPLIQLTIGPGENWASSLKVVNTNSYDVTYYATVVDFAPQGELGKGSFVPVLDVEEGMEGYTLGQWVKVSPEPLLVPAGQSADVPFAIAIPESAPPGGHYAAILIGTEPGVSGEGNASAKIATRVTSLLFVKISGDVNESGRIREFIAKKALYQTPAADFLLRFENIGNTHLRPRGDVTLYNMWGKERGKVAINQESNFGNVLPDSVRKFEFSWNSEASPFEIGRFSAVATLTYGEDTKQNTTATTYFWIVPLVPVSITLGSILAFFLVLAWFIRRYIRRALSLERSRSSVSPDVVRAPTVQVLMEPIREGVVDLRATTRPVATNVRAQTVVPELTWLELLVKYRLFFGFLALVVIGVWGAVVYLERATVSDRSYEIKDISSESEPLPPLRR